MLVGHKPVIGPYTVSVSVTTGIGRKYDRGSLKFDNPKDL